MCLSPAVSAPAEHAAGGRRQRTCISLFGCSSVSSSYFHFLPTDQVTRHLAEQTADLEAAAHPALDALTRKVTTQTLERVRRVKTRLVRLKTRVETVRRHQELGTLQGLWSHARGALARGMLSSLIPLPARQKQDFVGFSEVTRVSRGLLWTDAKAAAVRMQSRTAHAQETNADDENKSSRPISISLESIVFAVPVIPRF